MSKFLGTTTDKWGNNIYVTNFNAENVEFSTDLRKAILLSDEDKKSIGKTLKKLYKPNLKYIKLEKFDSIHATTNSALYNYNHSFLSDAAKFAKKEDGMSLECIDYAKNHIDNVNTFEEFGSNVAKILIEKYNLQKKG